MHVRPRRGARRGFATTERALRVSVSPKTDAHKLRFRVRIRVGVRVRDMIRVGVRVMLRSLLVLVDSRFVECFVISCR